MSYKLAYRRYSLPFRLTVRTGHGAWTHRDGLYVRLTDEDGYIGIGDCAPISWFGTISSEEAAVVCAALGEIISDEQIEKLDLVKFGCLRFALQSARAQIQHKHSTSTKTARQASSTTHLAPFLANSALLPAGRAALEKIPSLAEAGFRTFKWKVGAGDAADELAILDDVLAALPKGARLRLDANGAWPRRTAERWLGRCADCPIEFIEQPSTPAEKDLLLGLVNDYPTTLALDESVIGAQDVTHWIEKGWPGVYVLKPSLLGDVKRALSKLDAAGASERIVFSSALETAVGAHAALQIAFSYFAKHEKPRALGFGVWPLFADERFDGPRAAPFVRAEDLDFTKGEMLWNALN